ncbi:hypothetical protein KSD_41500 [Ktedonobacter sp. SOSP1-85]|nr:hypothetical protein KSD_41500 [Ktedonobacter sp. SOSP1-85]
MGQTPSTQLYSAQAGSVSMGKIDPGRSEEASVIVALMWGREEALFSPVYEHIRKLHFG